MSDLRDRIKDTIEQEPVVAFIKGTHEQAYCGNSDRAMQALRGVGAGFTTVDVLPDPRIREELSALSNWPTIPQVFVAGELVGGADIVQELALTGPARGDAGGEARRGLAPPGRRAHRLRHGRPGAPARSRRLARDAEDVRRRRDREMRRGMEASVECRRSRSRPPRSHRRSRGWSGSRRARASRRARRLAC